MYSMNDSPQMPGQTERNSNSHLEAESKPWTRRKTVILVGGILLAVLILTVTPFLTVVFIVQPVRVRGAGMSPTLNDGDRIFVGKRLGNLQRGDVVIFYYPEDPEFSYIKRIVGLPGELIEVRDGQTFINGTLLHEPYLDPKVNQSRFAREPVRIPEQNYFVMGDNRDNSSDSRTWGTLRESFIYGKVIGRYWP